MKQVLTQLNCMLGKRQKRGIVLLFFGSFFVALLDTLSVSLMAPFMSFLMDIETSDTGVLGQILAQSFGITSTIDILKLFSVFFILLYLIRGICKIIYNFWEARLLSLYRTELSIKLFTYLLHKPYSYHLRHNTAETLRLVNVDVGYSFGLLRTLMATASCGLVSIGIFVVLLSLNWQLTLLSVFVIAILVLVIKKKLKQFIEKLADINFLAASEMNKWVNQAIGGLKTTLVKRTQEYYITRYSISAKRSAIANSNYIAVDEAPKVLIDTACMVCIFGFVLVELLIGRDMIANLPVFATFAIAAIRLIPMAGQLTTTLNAVDFYRPSMNAIYDVIKDGEIEQNIAAILERGESKARKEKGGLKLERAIELQDISFHYGDTQQELFTGLNLIIPARKSVAFVGKTGAGKTTLADIILGLHDPTSGRILVDGEDIRCNPVGWANLVGYIPQFIYLCDDTIRANVSLGSERETVTDDWVWHCLERAQLKEFVEGLPEGLDTVIGENGIRLSGGQRQRIGIARALYCKPQFLLMDEATSSLDNDTERAIVDSINSLSGDLTMLIIAHRLTTIENCDLIYRIERGEATLEKGNDEDSQLSDAGFDNE